MKPEVPGDALTRHRTQILSHIADALAEALSVRSGSVWTATAPGDQASSGAQPTEVRVALRLAGALSGELLFSLATEESQGLLSVLEAEGGKDPAEVWLQWLEGLRSPLEKSFAGLPGSIAIGGVHPAAASRDGRALGGIALQSAEGIGGRVLLAVDATLDASLTRLVLHAEPGEPASDPAEERKPKIERVIDVPLPVTLRFGQRHLTLREVLALSTGSLVELDRQVEEPVDLVLGDRLIARGEVVIVDGNYGLRVTEVVERRRNQMDRLPTPPAADPPEAHAR